MILNEIKLRGGIYNCTLNIEFRISDIQEVQLLCRTVGISPSSGCIEIVLLNSANNTVYIVYPSQLSQI